MKVEIGLLNSFDKLKIIFSVSREGESASNWYPPGKLTEHARWCSVVTTLISVHTKEKQAVPLSDI